MVTNDSPLSVPVVLSTVVNMVLHYLSRWCPVPLSFVSDSLDWHVPGHFLVSPFPRTLFPRFRHTNRKVLNFSKILTIRIFTMVNSKSIWDSMKDHHWDREISFTNNKRRRHLSEHWILSRNWENGPSGREVNIYYKGSLIFMDVMNYDGTQYLKFFVSNGRIVMTKVPIFFFFLEETYIK